MEKYLLVSAIALASVIAVGSGRPKPAGRTPLDVTITNPAGSESLEITSTKDAYGGASFGEVGPYRVITGIVRGHLDPRAPGNEGIVDLDRATADRNGFVDYSTDFVILRPASPAHAKRILFYDVVNRGSKIALGTFNGAGNSFEAGQQGDALLLRQGYTIVWSGWQGDIAQSGDGTRIGAQFPVARNTDRSPVIGTDRAEVVFDNNTNPATITLSYPAATLDQSKAVLTARQTWMTPRGMSWNAPFVTIPASGWKYTDVRHVSVTRPANLDAGTIYEFVYPAKDPVVMGIGFAAVRDLISFLRYDSVDRDGVPNPLADLHIDLAIGEGISQSGRFMRDFLYQGFNNDGRGHKVFDGMIPIIPAARRTYTNFRWSEPGRWSKEHEDHFQPGDQFPFTYAVTTDPISGATDGLLKKCLASNTCPKIMQLDGAFELWGGRSSLLVTDGVGKAVTVPDNVRLYMVPGAQHGGGGGVGTARAVAYCKNLTSAVDERTSDRAIALDMEAWLADGTAPPPSNYPTLAGGTLVPPSAASNAAPYNRLYVTDYSNAIPVVNLNKPYVGLVPKTDADGNDLGGIRIPDVAVPLATYTGWNPRKAGYGAPDQCGSTGSTLPFAAGAEARRANGDSRLSIAERYSSEDDYVNKVRAAAEALMEQRLLLPEDVNFYVKQAQKAWPQATAAPPVEAPERKQ